MDILIVDDEVAIKPLFEQFFKKEIKEGVFTFHFALSAEEALNYLETTTSTIKTILILSDINMPGMNGFELLKILKSHFPTLKVFIITAYGDPTNQQRAEEGGADDFINKPIDFPSLKKKLISFTENEV